MEVKDVLEHLGYKLSPSNNYWRMSALYRKSNSLSLSVNKETGWFEDFVTGQNGPLSYLVALTVGISREDGDKYLKDLYFNKVEHISNYKENTIKNEAKFNEDFLNDLLPSYNFYKKRNISEKTIKEFQGGVKTYGKMNNRFVFPIFGEDKKIIGISGRDLFQSDKRPKWKILGKKNTFVYPSHITSKYIEEKNEVILVESIGDGLALYEAGIKNFLVLFGTKISKALILFLIQKNIEKIIVATNNDTDSRENWGNLGAQEVYNQLVKFFDKDKIQICLPEKKDFGDCSKQEIQQWAGQLSGQIAAKTAK